MAAGFFNQIAPRLACGRHDGIRDRPLAAATDLSARFIGEKDQHRAISCANWVPRARITAAHHSAFRAPQL